MALTGNFDLIEVRGEFGLYTRPSSNLVAFLNAIFGDSANRSLKSFEDHGKPYITSYSLGTSSDLDGKIDVTYGVNVGNLTTNILIEYIEDTGQLSEDGSDDWMLGVGDSFSTNQSSVSRTIDVPKNSTSYRVRLRFYNNFVSDPNDHLYHTNELGDTVTSSEETPPPQKTHTVRFMYTESFVWAFKWKHDETTSAETFQVDATTDGGDT